MIVKRNISALLLHSTCYSFNQTNNWLQEQVCPDRTWRPSSYPVGKGETGSWSEFKDGYDLVYNASYIPFSVDVERLSDSEIMSTCLTVAQCRFPPMLELVRSAENGMLWTPGFDDFDASDGKNVPSRQNNPDPVRHNYRSRSKIRQIVNTFYPRGSNVLNATIVRVDFSIFSKRLYLYIDLTCGMADGYERRGGFLGRNNGYFKEVLIKTSRLNIHHELRADNVAFSSKRSDYGDTNRNRRLEYVFNFRGSGSSVRRSYTWMALDQSWLTVDNVNSMESIPAHVSAGLKWAMLLQPIGNLPVAARYLAAANVELKKTKNKFSDVVIRAYGGNTYDFYKPAVLSLLSQGMNSNCLLAATRCIQSTPKKFLLATPPEAGCSTVINCVTWRSKACDDFGRELRVFLDPIRDTLYQSTPRCIDCPGLIGVSRNNIPPENALYNESVFRVPQCLPHRLNTGRLITTPKELHGY